MKRLGTVGGRCRRRAGCSWRHRPRRPHLRAGPPYPDAGHGSARLRLRRHLLGRDRSPRRSPIIDGIEARTGAQIAVYTQVKPESDTLETANADALALMDQWGVGRKGFDDGLVILFDMETNLRHGQVSLYAGQRLPGRVPERLRTGRRSSTTT